MIPVTVLTGFLGSGKTTLLNRVLADSAFADTAVIINEFGAIALDHLLVEAAIENTLVLQNGCICCTIRGDLVDTLQDLQVRTASGEIPRFSRVLVETTGLAQPGPIIQTLTQAAVLAPFFRFRSVVVTVDAVNGASQLAQYREASQQVAAADLLVLTKTDIASPSTAQVLLEMLGQLNPTVRIERADHGSIDLELIHDGPSWGSAALDLRGWLSPAIAKARPTLIHGAGPGLRYGGLASVEACCLTLTRAVPWQAVELWLNALISLRGADVLRLKGLVAIEGRPGPVIVQAVQHLLHPPKDLPTWPDDDPTSRIVVIGRNLPRAGLKASLDSAIAGCGRPATGS